MKLKSREKYCSETELRSHSRTNQKLTIIKSIYGYSEKNQGNSVIQHSLTLMIFPIRENVAPTGKRTLVVDRNHYEPIPPENPQKSPDKLIHRNKKKYCKKIPGFDFKFFLFCILLSVSLLTFSSLSEHAKRDPLISIN